MNKQTYRTLELIDEISHFCDFLSVEFFVGGVFPYGLSEQTEVNAPMAEIYVPETQIEELVEHIVSEADRNRIMEVDSADERYYRYVDNTTLFVDFDNLAVYDNNGIFVRIKPFSTDGKSLSFDNMAGNRKKIESENKYNVRPYFGHQLFVPDFFEAYVEALYDGINGAINTAFSNERYFASTEMSFTDALNKIDLGELSKAIEEKNAAISEYNAVINECNAFISDVQSQIRDLYEKEKQSR